MYICRKNQKNVAQKDLTLEVSLYFYIKQGN